MSAPRLVATDLDGTLLHSDGTITDRTREVLRALDEREVPVVFVTGRPVRWMEHLFEEVGGVGLAILSNGALVYDVAARRVLETTPLEREPGLDLAEVLRAAVPGIVLAVETGTGLRLEEGFLDVDRVPEGTPTGPLADVWDEPAVKLLARHPELADDALRDAVTEAVGETATPTWSMSGLVEISARDVTKAAALARVASRLGVEAADVVAFGDMPNDLPMLAWAGTSYAMANAHDSVKEVATHVAPAHDDDGVATVLAGIFDL
ncbi:Cof-type HAD-IIB family hydrolase [Nocardioides sp. SYSU D00038]|uniref:Cof-type HAD-IIB family hydrolase n=1 Tax=Nocardioides sp. SYSU D00038 TaxID=2812554 RepID=UPI001967E283|nr:Cof-type HAD-IIB family hydrolase [Nocardioides sp. SYSU D00038]